ncbi:hypothetical protein L596_021431 [Steinernema carpocapsae]|uniref:Uncharacterized protein n=1 Tax=Steinernema carpocapsae TaxID=34508 RepID=A0A4U5MIP7_STECR|nr:hypothetical protein L596_021431 [Steinernema carpocapsae]
MNTLARTARNRQQSPVNRLYSDKKDVLQVGFPQIQALSQVPAEIVLRPGITVTNSHHSPHWYQARGQTVKDTSVTFDK